MTTLSMKQPKKKKWFSSLILLLFALFVSSTALLSNLLKNPIKTQSEFIEQSLVFSNKELENITQLTLKNKSGEYKFERADTTLVSQWRMTSPRDISVNSVFVEKLFASLKVIKTKNILGDSITNNSNFSLDTPTSILTLTDVNNQSIELQVGIMNTIDNSTYMKISNKKNIYHVEAPSLSLENITLADLVESTVFDINFNTIISFKIFKKNSQTPQFEILKNEGQWTSTDGTVLDNKKVEDTIADFTNLKSNYILDQLNDQQKKQTQSLISQPEFTLKIEKENKEVMVYQISGLVKNLSDLPLKDSHFIIMESHAPVVYVIKKDFLTLFEIKSEILKDMLPVN